MSMRGPSEKTPTARSGSCVMTPLSVSSIVADAHAVADAEAEARRAVSILHEGAAAADQIGQRAIGIGDEPAVERIAGLDRLELDELGARVGARARLRHGGQLTHARDGGAVAGEIGDGARRVGRQRAARADLHVAAHQRPRRAPDRRLHAPGEAAHGDDGGDADGDARHEVDEVPPGAARLAPGHPASAAVTRGGRPPARRSRRGRRAGSRCGRRGPRARRRG